jgi:hypothetical protein
MFKNVLYIEKKSPPTKHTRIKKKSPPSKSNEKEEKPSPKYIGFFHVKFFFLQAILNPRLKNNIKKNPTP